jgi:hypothetical protein
MYRGATARQRVLRFTMQNRRGRPAVCFARDGIWTATLVSDGRLVPRAARAHGAGARPRIVGRRTAIIPNDYQGDVSRMGACRLATSRAMAAMLAPAIWKVRVGGGGADPRPRNPRAGACRSCLRGGARLRAARRCRFLTKLTEGPFHIAFKCVHRELGGSHLAAGGRRIETAHRRACRSTGPCCGSEYLPQCRSSPHVFVERGYYEADGSSATSDIYHCLGRGFI